jgi:hypothetical protein
MKELPRGVLSCPGSSTLWLACRSAGRTKAITTHAAPNHTATPQPLAGRTAIVTESTSGIGAAIAATLAREGAHVVVSGRDAKRGQTVVDDIVSAGGEAAFVAADLGGSYADLRGFTVQATSALGGRVDLVVNNAGVYPTTTTEALPDSDLDAMLAINIRTPHVLVAEIAPAMAERGHGAIVNVGSLMAQVGSPFGAMYRRPRRLMSNWPAAGPLSTGSAGFASTLLRPVSPSRLAMRRSGRCSIR